MFRFSDPTMLKFLDATIAGLAGFNGWLVVLTLVGVTLFAGHLVERR